MLNALKKAWRWTSDNAVVILSVLAGVLSAVIALLVFRGGRDGGSVPSPPPRGPKQDEIDRIEEEIKKLEGELAGLGNKEGHVDGQLVEVDKQIKTVDARIREKKARIRRLSAEQKLAEFKNLGY